MAFHDELAALKLDLKEAGIPVDDVLSVARVNRSSWTRWNQGGIPRTDRWAGVTEAAAKLLSERAERQDAA